MVLQREAMLLAFGVKLYYYIKLILSLMKILDLCLALCSLCAIYFFFIMNSVHIADFDLFSLLTNLHYMHKHHYISE